MVVYYKIRSLGPNSDRKFYQATARNRTRIDLQLWCSWET